MKTFAALDNNLVVNTIVADSLGDAETASGLSCIEVKGDNKAEVGGSYDPTSKKFIPVKPFASWILSSDYIWEPPTSKPNDNKSYIWDEDTTSWIEVTE